MPAMVITMEAARDENAILVDYFTLEVALEDAEKGSTVPNILMNSICTGDELHFGIPSVLAMGQGNLPTVRVWTTIMVQLGSQPVKLRNTLTVGGRNLRRNLLTCRFCRVWLDSSVPISSSAFRVSYLSLHSDMLLLIVKY